MMDHLKLWWRRWVDRNTGYPWCDGCPDREACGQGACYLDGGTNRPAGRR